MLVFGLKNIKVWVAMVLVLLCFSIWPLWGYPHDAEDEDPTAAKENLDLEEDKGVVQDEDEDYALEEVTGEENDKPRPCVDKWGECSAKKSGRHQCCEELTCSDLICVIPDKKP